MTEREKERENTKKNKAVNADIISGQRLYRLFDRTITVNVVKRQQGTDAGLLLSAMLLLTSV